MEFDDELDGEASGPPLPQPDRLWRHPSEVGLLARASRAPAPRPWKVAALAGVIGGLLGVGLTYVTVAAKVETVAVPAVVHQLVLGGTAAPGSSAASAPLPPVDAASVGPRVAPALVSFERRDAPGTSVGTGVIFRSDGMVLTTTRVAGTSGLNAVLADGRRLPARLVGADGDSGAAVLGLAHQATASFPAATLGASATLQSGTPALVMSATNPTVSTKVRGVGGSVDNGHGGRLLDMIQVEAKVPDGGWGGPLVDGNGAVIGITWGPAGDGLVWATPIEFAYSAASQLVESGRITHAWLGIEGNDLDATSARALGLPGGAMVKKVLALSPASTAGLGPGDVITVVDGHPVSSMAQLLAVLATHHPGDRVVIRVRHGLQERDMTVTLVERPTAPVPSTPPSTAAAAPPSGSSSTSSSSTTSTTSTSSTTSTTTPGPPATTP